MTKHTFRRAFAGVTVLSVALLSACAAGGGVESARHPAEAPVPHTPPVSEVTVALDHANELVLTDAQRFSLTAIRRGLDSANAPLRVRLDSLNPSQRPVNPRDLSQEQRDAIRVRRAAAEAIMKDFEANNAAVRPRVFALLTEEQRKRVTELTEEIHKRDAERLRAEWESGERRGQYGRP